jgi:heme/copper-type cytochrome/quinol oxidase subunit 2
MRVPAAVLAVAATVALAGCSSAPQSPVDPQKAERADYVVPAVVFGLLAAVGLALLGVLLVVRRRKARPPAVSPEDGALADGAKAAPRAKTRGR